MLAQTIPYLNNAFKQPHELTRAQATGYFLGLFSKCMAGDRS